ncbi:hypothetical protein [Aeromonas phage 59.1]|nr:hypothetical protein [Aeromonas phage 59.1]
MINMVALNELLSSQGITPRIERIDIFGELEFMSGAGDVLKDWPPKPKRHEQTLAIGYDETGAHVAVFIPKVT